MPDVIRSIELLEAISQEHEGLVLDWHMWDDFYASTLANVLLDASVESEINKHRKEYVDFLFEETKKEEKHISCKSLALDLFLNNGNAPPWAENDEIAENHCAFPSARKVTTVFLQSECGEFSTWLGVTNFESFQKKIEYFMKCQIIKRRWNASPKEARDIMDKYDAKWSLPQFLQDKARRIAMLVFEIIEEDSVDCGI